MSHHVKAAEPPKCNFCGRPLIALRDMTAVRVHGTLVVGCADRPACLRRREDTLLDLHKRMNQAYEEPNP